MKCPLHGVKGEWLRLASRVTQAWIHVLTLLLILGQIVEPNLSFFLSLFLFHSITFIISQWT